MNRALYLIFLCILSSCTNYGQLIYVADLPGNLEENSGIVTLKDSTVWVIEDNGNKDDIYKVDFRGNILKSFEVKNAKNKDWEDLAKDKNDNVYIADIGNNNNTRKDLVVYKVPNPETEPGDKIDAEKIEFYYPEQKDFPPEKSKRFYDAEALLHYGSSLYIATKNRSNPFTGQVFIYKIPDVKGKYEAKLVGILQICTDWNTCQITGMDISPDGKKIVLLSYGKLFILSNFSENDFSKASIKEIDLGNRNQLESICFLDSTTLLLSDEVSHGQGGNLYRYQLMD
ncbi:hypothetical protein [Maribacter aestuarii]|uniref:hypothetical protein n=1 Tax=Maribacter aestuarii TaxID=1130723 RepID=UPI00248CC703|nr:hypothetical protein [Maribacter aestuarii]